MNQAVRFLERPPVIRLFGIALILAPIVNIWIAVAIKTQVQTNWSPELLWRVATTSLKLPSQILYVASMAIGASMLRGRPSAWKFVLGLLGGYILLQFTTLIPDMRRSWTSGLMFLINVSIFYYIADQLVWKLQIPTRQAGAAPKPTVGAVPAPAPAAAAATADRATAPIPLRAQAPKAPATVHKSLVVAFDGIGPWAELSGVTNKGLSLRRKQSLPFDFAGRDLEVQLPPGLKLTLRFDKREGDEFFFGFTELRPDQARELNRWLSRQAA